MLESRNTPRTASLLLAAVGFLMTTTIQMVNPILALYAYDYLQATIEQVGLIISAFFVSSFISKFLLGALISPRRSLLAAVIGAAVSCVAPISYSYAQTPEVLAGLRIVHGFSQSVTITTLLTAASLIARPGQESRALTRYTTSLALGLMAGPAVGTLAVQVLGVRSTLVLATILSLPGVALGILLYKSVEISSVYSAKATWRDLWKMPFRRGVAMATFAYFAFSFAYGVLLTYSPINLTVRFGVAETMVPALFFGYFASSAAVRLALHRLISRLGLRYVLLAGLGLIAAMLVVMWQSSTFPIFATAFMVTGASHGAIFPVAAIIVANSTEPESRVAANAVYLTSFDLGNTVGPIVASQLVLFLPIPTVIGMSTILPVLGILVVLRLKPTGPAAVDRRLDHEENRSTGVPVLPVEVDGSS